MQGGCNIQIQGHSRSKYLSTDNILDLILKALRPHVVFNLMLQDLLRQCIRVEVGERLSLEAILGHPWLLPNASNSSLDPTKPPGSGGLGGLPIPSREHGAKGISHPQVKRVTDACIHL